MVRLSFDDLNSFRAKIAGSRDLREASERSLVHLLGSFPYQSASLFVLESGGFLKRELIYGRDRNGRTIDRTWLADETYRPGEGLLGSVLLPQTQDTGSAAIFKVDPGKSALPRTFREYRRFFGEVRSLFVVQLIEEYGPIGVLLFVNRLTDDRRRILRNPVASKAESDAVIAFAGCVTAVVSSLRAKQEQKTISELFGFLAEAEDQHTSCGVNFYEVGLSRVVAPDSLVRAGVLRLADPDGTLHVKAVVGHPDVDWRHRDNSPISPSGAWLSNKVTSAKERIIVPDVHSESGLFRNRRWIIDNDIRSAACFPVWWNRRIIGNITFYTCFSNGFHHYVVNFLEDIPRVIVLQAALERFRRAEIEFARYQDRSALSITEIELRDELDAFKHDQSAYLLRIIDALANVITDLDFPHLREERLTDIKHEIEARRTLIERSLREENIEDVCLPEFIGAIVRSYQSGLCREDITVSAETNTSRCISVEKARFQALLDNLLSNAIRAVRQYRRTGGLVSLQVRETIIDGSPYLEFRIQDNGAGMPPEAAGMAGTQPFTTHPEGHGKGLRIVRRIAEHYGGEFLIESAPGCGTMAVVRLNLDGIPESHRRARA